MMQGEPDAHDHAQQRIARGRIETIEVAPQAAPLVAGDKAGTMPTRAALLVAHADRAGEQHLVACIAQTPTQVEIFGMQEIRFVEAADLSEGGARQVHACAGHRFDDFNAIGHRRGWYCDAGQCGAAGLETGQPAHGHQRPTQGRLAAAHGTLGPAQGILDTHADESSLRMASGDGMQAFDRIGFDQAIGIEEQQCITSGQRGTPVAGRTKAEVACLMQDAQARITRMRGERRLGFASTDGEPEAALAVG